MPIKPVSLNTVTSILPVDAIKKVHNPFDYSKAIQQEGLKLADDPSIYQNPQASLRYLA